MKTTWEKIVHHVGTIHGEDISNELQNRATVVVLKPQYSDDVLELHKKDETHRMEQHTNLQNARNEMVEQLKALKVEGKDPSVTLELAKMENEIAEEDFKFSKPLSIRLEGTRKPTGKQNGACTERGTPS